MQNTPTQTDPSQDTPRQLLANVFGHAEFREHQQSIIAATLRGQDAFAVMPTGAGKSICYQLPALSRPGTCIVVSPLISLMKDQVDKLCRLGIKAAYLNSSLTATQQARVLEKLQKLQYDLLYVAPERFGAPAFRTALPRMQPSLFAIDEAHCISEWGHDFRPDYLALSKLSSDFPDVPITAFTATATHRTQEDIVRRLGLRDPHMVRASFDRPNLFYQVEEKHDDLQQIHAFVHARPDETGIVYRGTRCAVEETAEHLRSAGIAALPYHAGMDPDIRRAHQEAFDNGACRVIVATIAFGMGIDKPDVRYVVHGDLPKNIDSYYQETGRAGRDGQPAHCLLLLSMADTARIRYFINKISDPDEKRNAGQKLSAMVHLATDRRCRRQSILAYFGERYQPRNCGECDVCQPHHRFNTQTAPGKPREERRPSTLCATLELIRDGLPLGDIASRRGLAATTIAGHIAALAAEGEVEDISRHVAATKVKMIQSLFARHGTEHLKPIIEAARGQISYDEARIVRGCLVGRDRKAAVV